MKIKYFISILFLYFMYCALGCYILNYNISNRISNGNITSFLKNESKTQYFHFLMKRINNIIER